MQKRWLAWLSVVLLVSLFLGACAGETNNGTNVTPVAPGAEGEGGEELPETGNGEAGEGEPVNILIWHGYTETEEEAFSSAVNSYMDENPNVTIELLAVPFDQLQQKFQTEASAGGGPTLITGPQDRMAGYAQAGLLAPIPEDAEFLGEITESAVEGGRYEDALVGVPINSKVVAMYYNRSMVETPPETMDDLLAAAEENGLAITSDWFHNYMWVPAFGAELFDEEFVCVLDQTGGAAALEYLNTICESPGVTCDPNDGDMDIVFRQQQAAFRFQGPWIAGDAIADLGEENVGVAPVPTISGEGDPQPWNQSEMIQMNVNAAQAEQDAAMDFMAYLVSADVQQMFLEQANWIPVNESVDVSGNPVVGGFLDQVPQSQPFPVAPELGATWDPMQNAVTSVLEDAATPEDAAAEACRLINEANNKTQ